MRVYGRVVQLDRSYPLVELAYAAQDVAQSFCDCAQDCKHLRLSKEYRRAEHAISLVKDKEQDIRATIGDWLVLELDELHDKARILSILERKNELKRWDGSSLGKHQILAANLDQALIVLPLQEKPLAPQFLMRMLKALVLAFDAGLEACVLLSKIDRKHSQAALEEDMELVRQYLGALTAYVPVIAVSVCDGRGIDELRQHIDRPQMMSVLLGQSGAGKSSLVNALLGVQLCETQEVRSKDDKGRHTTVARTLIELERGGALIDAPGLRSFPLRDQTQGMQATFPEIFLAAQSCKFRDCLHEDEPDCKVRELVEASKLSALRLDMFRLLIQEMQRTEEKMDISVRRTRR